MTGNIPAVVCWKCKKPIEASDVFCRFCAAHQRRDSGGLMTYWPSTSPTLTAAIGPSHGMSEIESATDAPIIAAIFGKPDFAGLKFTINGSVFAYGDFLNALITFLFVAAAVFFFVVAPMTHLIARQAQEDPDTKECPECTKVIPAKARRCPECTAQLRTA